MMQAGSVNDALLFAVGLDKVRRKSLAHDLLADSFPPRRPRHVCAPTAAHDPLAFSFPPRRLSNTVSKTLARVSSSRAGSNRRRLAPCTQHTTQTQTPAPARQNEPAVPQSQDEHASYEYITLEAETAQTETAETTRAEPDVTVPSLSPCRKPAGLHVQVPLATLPTEEGGGLLQRLLDAKARSPSFGSPKAHYLPGVGRRSVRTNGRGSLALVGEDCESRLVIQPESELAAAGRVAQEVAARSWERKYWGRATTCRLNVPLDSRTEKVFQAAWHRHAQISVGVKHHGRSSWPAAGAMRRMGPESRPRTW